ncbi:hypothetical protein GCM10022224_019790 [Nonomuraea antimicrobica]|uniref:Uncharacterized protein n=1 Tax=Nonomuraea antimicrobica TaxID=561173 RepID=A0ABP7BEB9_9ACTN
MSGGQRKFELSMPQILGSALAAVTAAVAASYLGVAGTVIGAAVFSVASTVGTAIYTHYLKRTGERVKQHASPAPRTEDSTLVLPRVRRDRRLPWAKVGAAAAIVFGISMGSILVYQAAAQQTVHEQVTGKTPAKAQQRDDDREPPAGRETESRAPAYPPPQTGAPWTPEPGTTPTPSRTPSARPTREPTPTPTPTPSSTPTTEDPGSGSLPPSDDPATSTPPPQEQEPGTGDETPAVPSRPAPGGAGGQHPG